MMMQIAKFAYVDEIKGLNARVLELPYGTEDTLAMLVMLPNRGSTVKQVVNNLMKLGLLSILDGSTLSVGKCSLFTHLEINNSPEYFYSVIRFQ